MLTSIRKVQKSVLVVVTAIICIAFAYLYTEYDTGATGGGSFAIKVDGKPYRRAEAVKMANYFNVAFFDLGRASMFSFTPLGEFAMSLMGRDPMNQDRTNFVVNLLVLRKAAERLGVEATPEQIDEAIKELGVFNDPSTGSFDPNLYNDYIRTQLGRYSMREADLRELFGDYVKYDKIRQLIGSGMAPAPSEIDEAYRRQYETFRVHQYFLDKDQVVDEVEVSEEAIQQYYENNREILLSEPRRSFSYLEFPLPERGEDEGDEQWRAKRMEVAKAFNEVLRRLSELMDDEGLSLDEAVARLEGREAQTSGEPFPASSPPEAFADQMDLIDTVFAMNPEFPDQTETAETEDAIYLVWLDEVIPAQPLELEEARDRIVANLESQEEERMMQEVAAEKRSALVAKLEEGVPPSEAAAATGFELQALQPFSRSEPPEGSDFASTVRGMAPELQAGELSEPAVLGDGVLIVHVVEREVPQRDSEPEDRQRIADSLRAMRATQAFRSWFARQREDTETVLPVTKDAEGNDVPVSIDRYASL